MCVYIYINKYNGVLAQKREEWLQIIDGLTRSRELLRRVSFCDYKLVLFFYLSPKKSLLHYLQFYIYIFFHLFNTLFLLAIHLLYEKHSK